MGSDGGWTGSVASTSDGHAVLVALEIRVDRLRRRSEDASVGEAEVPTRGNARERFTDAV